MQQCWDDPIVSAKMSPSKQPAAPRSMTCPSSTHLTHFLTFCDLSTAVSSRAKIRTACCRVYVIYVDLYRYTFIIFCPLLSSVCFLRNGHRIVLDRFDFWKEGSLAERPRSQRKGYRNIETLGVTVFSCEMMWEKVCWMGQFYAFLFLQNFKWDIQ